MNPNDTDKTELGTNIPPETAVFNHDTGQWGHTEPMSAFTGGPSQSSNLSIPDPSAMDQPYPIAFGPYDLIGELARGGMGVVYKARQRDLGRMVALKMILGGLDVHPSSIQRLELEARAAASLDHPNVVPIYDTGEINGRRFFSMAFVDGPNLKAYVDKLGRLPISETVRLFTQIVEGVAHAHRSDIIHRDLKPANILIDRDNRPRVTDFGLAKRTDTETDLTRTGQVMGTPQYMAPEQARGSKDAGKPADIYSLGAILYYLLAGRPPIQGDSVTDLLVRVVMEAPDPPHTINPDVPADIEAICMKCLEKKPSDRYPDAVALAVELAPLAVRYSQSSSTDIERFSSSAGMTTSLQRSSTTIQDKTATLQAPSRSNWQWVAAGVTAAAAVLIVAGIAFWPKSPPVNGTGGSSVASAGSTKEIASANAASNTAAAAVASHGARPATELQPRNVDLPLPFRKDFNLNMIVNGEYSMGKDGLYLFRRGSKLSVRFNPEVDCQVALFSIDPSGDVLQFFPNKYDSNNRLAAGTVREVPPATFTKGVQPYELQMEATEGTGNETLRIVATTDPEPMMLPKADMFAMDIFPLHRGKEGKARVDSFLRGVKVVRVDKDPPNAQNKNDPQQAELKVQSGPRKVTELEIPFRVNR